MSTSNQFMLGNTQVLAHGGVTPSIAMSGNQVVAIYRELNAVSSGLYYYAGTANEFGQVNFGSSTPVSNNNSGSVDSGETPSIGLNNQNVVIEFHEANGPSSELWSHVGIINAHNNQQIDWGNHQDSGHSGYLPSVSVAWFRNKNMAVAAYLSGSSNNTIYILIGTIDKNAKTVTWIKISKTFTGTNPKISMNDNGKVAIVYDGNNDTIFSCVGQMNNDCTDITWSVYLTTIINGSNNGFPAVWLNNDNTATVLYQGLEISDDLASIPYSINYPIKAKFGLYNGDLDSLSWGDELYAGGLGKKPGVASNGSVVISVQETADYTEAGIARNNGNILYASSKIVPVVTNRINWMSQYPTYTLKQLVLPAAHDAGMSQVGYCTNLAQIHSVTGTKTQSKSFKQMLDLGIRYFDVRPVWKQTTSNGVVHNTPYTGHFSNQAGGVGCLGVDMDSVFRDVNNYITEGYQEVIILKFSHYFQQIVVDDKVDNTVIDTNDAASAVTFNPLKKALIESMYSTLRAHLFNKSTSEYASSRLVDIPINKIATYNTRIIAVFDQVDLDALYPLVGVSDPTTLAHNQAVRACIYTYGDYYIENQPPSQKSDFDMVVYDRYTNTDILNDMTSAQLPSDANHPGQLYQFNQAPFHTGSDLYLVSWTLTQQTTREIITGSPSIETLAKNANAVLGNYMQTMIQSGNISATMMPNLIYVDFCDTFVTDICNFLNASIVR